MIKYIKRIIRLFSKSKKESYLLFYKILGFYPDNTSYYELALRHKSIPIQTNDGRELSNERLEFLGDAVLNSLIADIVFHRFADEREGFLTNLRSKIVSRESLNQIAIEMGLDKMVIATRYVSQHATHNIYGNALEALIGAIYLDKGYKKCKRFVEERIIRHFIDWNEVLEHEVNYKSKFLEWCHKNRLEPEFILLNEEVNNNKHTFHTCIQIADQIICQASGNSKKESQQNAARLACQQIVSEENFLSRFQSDGDNIVYEENILDTEE